MSVACLQDGHIQQLEGSGFELDRSGCFHSEPHGESVETLYRALLAETPPMHSERRRASAEKREEFIYYFGSDSASGRPGTVQSSHPISRQNTKSQVKGLSVKRSAGANPAAKYKRDDRVHILSRLEIVCRPTGLRISEFLKLEDG